MEALLALLKGVARRSKLLGVRETLFSFGTIWMDGIGIGKDTGAEGDIIGRNSRGRFGGDNGKMLRRRWAWCPRITRCERYKDALKHSQPSAVHH